MDLLITGGTLLTQNRSRELLRADVLVQNGRIAAIAPTLDATRCTVIDAGGRVVMPGLVQSHLHLCQTLFRGLADELALLDWLRKRIWPLEGAHTPESLRASARLGIAELIRGGTTTIQDMGTVHHTDAIFEALEETGLRAVAGKAMMDKQAGAPRGLRESPQGGKAGTLASVRESERLCRRWDGAANGRLRYGFAPRFALSCTEKLLRDVGVLARELGARIHTHSSENQDEIAAVRAQTGTSNLEYLHSVGLTGNDVGLAHCIWLSETEERILRETGTHVLHCPSSNLKLGSGVARVPELLAQGVSVSIGADGAACANDLDGFLEMRLASLLQKPRLGPAAMPAQTVLDLMTLGGAKALGLQNEIGSLEVGKRADLIVVDVDRLHCGPGGNVASRLVYAARSTDVTDVVIDGRPVLRHGLHTTLDEGQVRADARRELASLLTRVELRR